MPKYQNRYEKPRIPAPPGIPVLKSVDAVLSHIAKFRVFIAPQLVWTDTDSNGKIIQQETYGIMGEFFAPQGVTRCYVLRDYTTANEATRPKSTLPKYQNLYYAPLFVWDKETRRWYRNARPTLNTEEHPCHPCTPPDEPVIPLPDSELRYLMRHGVMGLMEAKVNGYFEPYRDSKWSSKSWIWTVIDEFGG